MDNWKPGEESCTVVPKKIVVLVGAEKFPPHLDMEMSFDENQTLCFGIYTKPNFQSKYLNVGSCRPSACKKAIVRGVSIRTT